ncbi:alpha-amylase family glycosyl hydrolase [Alistipes sp.]|uniref:alpha-amylase family glycosyl hydrolase n=1 Tax=Alistipes sp. TaxID=1872444 RepID=UPI0025B830EB|nr:alpha-amylase family glycosyl hydrolase [Alistipes sp.]
MRKYLFALLAFAFSAFVSCGDDKADEIGGGLLSVSPAELVFEAAGGSRVLDLRTDAKSWSLTQSENSAWCVPALTSGKISTSFVITVEANESSKREATLTFTAPGCEPVVVSVTQSGDPALDFEGEEVVAEPDAWDDRKRADISYQLLVYSFADGDGDKVGDLQGLIRKLDYIDALGVSAVWLSPIHPAASYHGYDVLDYAAVNPDFGTDADLQAFINAAHARGIRVYLDYVLNHTAKDHPWFRSAIASEDSPYRDYYVFSEDPQADIAAGRIAQIATEGASGYDSGQWFSTDTGSGASGRFKFVLDWTDADSPTVTVSETTDAADADNTQSGADDKYLYYSDNTSKRFYPKGDGRYELTLDFDSDWGFLIRTSTSSWAAGTKYGAPDNRTIIRFGDPFPLMSNRSAEPANVQFSLPTMYHSHFWTAAFADLNYGKADEAEQSGAFEAVAEAADKWVRMGVDGFRLDAVKHIYHNASGDENPTFLKKFYDRMNRTYKAAGGEGDFYMVGEMLDEAANAAPYYRGLPALFEFTFWYKLKWALQNGIGCYFVKDILDAQSLYAQYRGDYIEATKLSNHDEDRTGSDLGRSVEKMKVAAAVLLTAQGSPYIYQGEELGYWGTKANGDEYVRAPILWDEAGSDLASGSLSGKIDMQMLTAAISVEAQQDEENSLLNHYRTFARLRNTYPALAEGKMTQHPVYNDSNTSQQSIAAWYRELDGERMLVVHNFGDEMQILTLTDPLDKAVGVSGEVKLQRGDTQSKLFMGACSSVVFAL